MRILVVGPGGREHALVTALAADESVTELHVTPGNAGMDRIATCHPEAGKTTDGPAMVRLAQEVAADLVVIGPETPLVAGVADALRQEGFNVFGPSKQAAMIEGSKNFAKTIMREAGVRTAQSLQLLPGTSAEQIASALDDYGPNWVVKDDGLAAGKGVVVTTDRRVAEEHVAAVHASGNPVLLEEHLTGPEISLFCLVSGETVVPLIPAQDHKRVGDNDEGPNTGGMGAYTPLPWLDEDAVRRIVDEVCAPVAKQLVARGTPYTGLLYAGLFWTPDGPSVIEFNARFGDPETQPILSLLRSPLAGLLSAVATGTLADYVAANPLVWEEGYAVTVVMASPGYPASYEVGIPISGPDLNDPAVVLHAGTAEEDGGYVSAGGRVLNVIGKGATLAEAREAAYRAVERIEFPRAIYRRDIAQAAADGRITLT